MSRKTTLLILSTFFSFFIFNLYAYAAATYTALAPLQTPNGTQMGTSPDLATYFSQMYQIGVGVASALAVLMVIWGGVEYVTTDAIGGKEEGKEKVQNAILGLVLALGSYLILQTINPALLNTNLTIQQIQTAGSKYTNQITGGDTASNGPGTSGLNGGSASYDAWGNWTDQNQKDLESAYAKVGALSYSGTFNYLTGQYEGGIGGDPTTMSVDQLKSAGLTAEEIAAVQTSVANTAAQANIDNIVAQGGTIGSSGTPNGTIAANTLAGMSFPASSGVTNQQVLDMISNSGLLNLNPTDAAKYFPGGIVTPQGYESLLASIANSESGFNPNDNTTQHLKDGSSAFSSEGLFSLSVGDPAVQAIAQQKGITPQDVINNPVYNTQAAINILKNQIQNQGSITGGSTTGYWGPLRRSQ